MTEAEWQGQVVQLAETLGYRVLHVRRSIGKGQRWSTTTSIVGWPDLLCIPIHHPERGLVAIELKSEKGVVTDEQAQVLDELRRSGVRTMVARPSDLDAVVALLRS